MPGTVTTTTTELPDSRVRVDVEVAPEAVERELKNAAQALGRDLKISGFRKGHVPPQVVLQRVGREAVLDEAVRRALPAWYEEALSEAHLNTVGDPAARPRRPARQGLAAVVLDRGGHPPAGQARRVQGARGGQAASPRWTSEEVDEEIERLRESLASLETVDRAAANGDFVVIDFVGKIDGEPFEGGEGRGYLLELGSGRFIPGFEEQLTGASAGDERDVSVDLPRGLRRRGGGRQGRGLLGDREGGQGEAPAGAGRRLRRRGRRLRQRSTRCARTSSRSCARPRSA